MKEILIKLNFRRQNYAEIKTAFLNPDCITLYFVDGRRGYAVEEVSQWLWSTKAWTEARHKEAAAGVAPALLWSEYYSRILEVVPIGAKSLTISVKLEGLRVYVVAVTMDMTVATTEMEAADTGVSVYHAKYKEDDCPEAFVRLLLELLPTQDKNHFKKFYTEA